MARGGADTGPPFIGLTGAIGAGKSTALAALQRLGAVTLSSDAVVHQLYQSDEVRDAVVARFGPEVAPDGVIERGRLAAVAFATPEDTAWLEGLIWPRVRDAVTRWRGRTAHMEPPPRALVVEVPLLFEAGQEHLYDVTVAVTVDEDIRRARSQGRGHQALEERAARQLSQAEKAARATFVVTNHGDIDTLERNLAAVLEALGR